jgi:flagellar assembly protein FliH
MKKKSDPAIIPLEDSGEFSRWLLPEVQSRGGVITVEKSGAGGRFRQVDQTRKRQPPGAAKTVAPTAATADNHSRRAGEIVEDVDMSEAGLQVQPFTAEQLQALTEAAEKEGFDKGFADGLGKGFEEGLKRGAAEGRREAMAKAEAEASAELSAELARLQQVAAQLLEPISTQNAQLEQVLLGMVCGLTRQLIGRELVADAGDILAVVRQALAALPVGAKQIRIFLNPDDLALVEAYAQEKYQDWQFFGDSTMLPGGCRLETGESLVDYTVETRMNALLEQVMTRQLAADSCAVEPASAAPGATDRVPDATP